MEFIKGKWYKNLGEYKNIIAKYTNTTIYRGINYFVFYESIYNQNHDYHFFNQLLETTNDTEEIPISDIVNFLPDKHPERIIFLRKHKL